MTEPKTGITRRDFMRGAASAALASAVGFPLASEAEGAAKSRVVLIRDAGVLDARGKINASVLGRMLDQAVAKLLGESSSGTAWKRLVKPSDMVGIKSNSWNRLPTPPELEKIIADRIVAAGVPERRVFCDDRGSQEKFQASTALINVRPARAHHWAGMGGCIKNYIIFTPNPPQYHPDSCADLATVWDLPIVKGKTRLNILVLLTPQFYGHGPHGYDPRHVWSYKGLAVSLDPVAVDAVGAHLLKTKRIQFFGEDRPITPTKHIALADTRHHLGTSDLSKIALVPLGWTKDSLI